MYAVPQKRRAFEIAKIKLAMEMAKKNIEIDLDEIINKIKTNWEFIDTYRLQDLIESIADFEFDPYSFQRLKESIESAKKEAKELEAKDNNDSDDSES